jgi:hypothetical protein
MCVCMCAYVFICVYVYNMYVCTYVCSMYVCVHICLCMYVVTYVRRTYIRGIVCMYVCVLCIYSVLYLRRLLVPVLSCPVLSCPVLSCSVPSRPVPSCPVLSCPVLSYPILSCPVLSCAVLSCPALSCPVLSGPVRPERTMFITAVCSTQFDSGTAVAALLVVMWAFCRRIVRSAFVVGRCVVLLGTCRRFRAWSLKMAPIGCYETSVTNYQSSLHNIPEEWRHVCSCLPRLVACLLCWCVSFGYEFYSSSSSMFIYLHK